MYVLCKFIHSFSSHVMGEIFHLYLFTLLHVDLENKMENYESNQELLRS